MTKFSGILLAAILILLPQGAMASSMLGTAGDYNGFIFENYIAANSQVQGRLAVGGSAVVSSYGIGNGLPYGSSGDALVVGGSLTGTWGSVNGDVRVGSYAVTAGFGYRNLYQHSTGPINFSAERARLSALSGDLTSLASNGRISRYHSTYTLTGDNSDLVVFNMKASQLTSAKQVSLEGVGANTTVIINVSGNSVNLHNMGFAGFQGYNGNILFNFFEASHMRLSGLTLYGSVLAPDAMVTGGNGAISGTLVARQLNSTFALMNSRFEGGAGSGADPVPEPSTMVLMAAGLLGVFFLRRR